MGVHKQRRDHITHWHARFTLYWLRSCGRWCDELNCKMWNWISIIFLQFLLFSPLTATAGRDFANTVNCGQKLYSPCFIDLTILSWGSGFSVINNETMVTCDSGDWRHQSVYIPMLSCSGCLVIVVHCCMWENGSKFLQLTLVNLFQKKKSQRILW